MQKMIQPEADAFLAKKRRRCLWTRLVSVLGCVAQEQIVGKIIFRIWPLNRLGVVR